MSRYRRLSCEGIGFYAEVSHWISDPRLEERFRKSGSSESGLDPMKYFRGYCTFFGYDTYPESDRDGNLMVYVEERRNV